MNNEAIAIELLKIGFETKFEKLPLLAEEHKYTDKQIKLLVKTYVKILNELNPKQA